MERLFHGAIVPVFWGKKYAGAGGFWIYNFAKERYNRKIMQRLWVGECPGGEASALPHEL
jgi:hypothetical protein